MLTWRRYLPEPAAPDPDPVGQISQRDRLQLSRHVVRRLTRDWRENPMSATETLVYPTSRAVGAGATRIASRAARGERPVRALNTRRKSLTLQN